jgi:hypothetical protein
MVYHFIAYASCPRAYSSSARRIVLIHMAVSRYTSLRSARRDGRVSPPSIVCKRSRIASFRWCWSVGRRAGFVSWVGSG